MDGRHWAQQAQRAQQTPSETVRQSNKLSLFQHSGTFRALLPAKYAGFTSTIGQGLSRFSKIAALGGRKALEKNVF